MMAGVHPGDWSTSDKTSVDLEIKPAVTATRHAHPRGARQYHHDETEVDLATPLPASEIRKAAPEPAPAEPLRAVPGQEDESPQ